MDSLISGSKVRVLVRPPIKPLKFQHEILQRGSSSVRSDAKGSKEVPTFAREAERVPDGEWELGSQSSEPEIDHPHWAIEIDQP